jgi:hypothetical protein
MGVKKLVSHSSTQQMLLHGTGPKVSLLFKRHTNPTHILTPYLFRKVDSGGRKEG